jgi:hypothetical protein
MYCPICRAEYIRAATMCSDCQVALVPELPASQSENANPADESFVLIWAGMAPHRHDEICEILERAGIPARTIHQDDHIFGTSLQSAFNVYVAASQVAKAKALFTEPGAPNVEQENGLIDDPEIDELPAEDDAPEEDDHRQERSNVTPEDATAEIWSGEDRDLGNMIIACLRENQIYCRTNQRTDDEVEDSENPPEEIEVVKLFVLPEDESRAREIIHEIIDAAPPP